MKKSAQARADATIASAEQAPTFLEILIDETSSMGCVKPHTIAAFNSFIEEQRQLGESCQVTMTKFSTYKVTTPYEMIDLAMVPALTPNTFNPSGSTNLFDTIEDRINALSATIGNIPCNVLFIVLTDGEDNQSRRADVNSIRRRLGERMEAGWTFVYLGAFEQALDMGLQMGFPEGNIKAFSNVEIGSAMAQTSMATTAYRSARSSGAVAASTASMNYFSGEENNA